MKKTFRKDDNAAVGMIVMGALILVLSVIVIPVFYNIASSVSPGDMDADVSHQAYPPGPGPIFNAYNNSTLVTNATTAVITVGNSVMQLNPLAALVAVAGGIIGILLAVLSPKLFAGAGI